MYHAEIPIPKLAGIVAERLKSLNLPAFLDGSGTEIDRDNLVAAFAWLAKDPASDANDFDAVMAELYDWADTPLDGHWNGRKLCWVKTTQCFLHGGNGVNLIEMNKKYVTREGRASQ